MKHLIDEFFDFYQYIENKCSKYSLIIGAQKTKEILKSVIGLTQGKNSNFLFFVKQQIFLYIILA